MALVSVLKCSATLFQLSPVFIFQQRRSFSKFFDGIVFANVSL